MSPCWPPKATTELAPARDKARTHSAKIRRCAAKRIKTEHHEHARRVPGARRTKSNFGRVCGARVRFWALVYLRCCRERPAAAWSAGPKAFSKYFKRFARNEYVHARAANLVIATHMRKRVHESRAHTHAIIQEPGRSSLLCVCVRARNYSTHARIPECNVPLSALLSGQTCTRALCSGLRGRSLRKLGRRQILSVRVCNEDELADPLQPQKHTHETIGVYVCVCVRASGGHKRKGI